jgi:hypothetical protein
MGFFKARTINWLGALVVAFGTAAGPADAQDIDPATLEQSRKILELTNTLAMGEQMLSLLMPQITNLVAKANPQRGDEVAQLIRQHLEPSLRKALPELLDECAKVYARHFTFAELTELTQFYGTPLGQKVIQSQSALMLELNQVGQHWGMGAAQRALQELAPIFKERGLQVPI